MSKNHYYLLLETLYKNENFTYNIEGDDKRHPIDCKTKKIRY